MVGDSKNTDRLVELVLDQAGHRSVATEAAQRRPPFLAPSSAVLS